MRSPLMDQIRLAAMGVFLVGFGCGVCVGVIIMRIMVG